MLKRKLGLITLIGLAVITSSCKEDQPRMPVIKLCDYLKPDPKDPSKDYLFCKLTNGDESWEQIIPIVSIPTNPQSPNEKVVCTTLNNLTALKIFSDNTQSWINNNCQSR